MIGRILTLVCIFTCVLSSGAAFALDGTGAGALEETITIRNCENGLESSQVTAFSIGTLGAWSMSTSEADYAGDYTLKRVKKKKKRGYAFNLTLDQPDYDSLVEEIGEDTNQLCGLAPDTLAITEARVEKFIAKLSTDRTTVTLKLVIAAKATDGAVTYNPKYSMLADIAFTPTGGGIGGKITGKVLAPDGQIAAKAPQNLLASIADFILPPSNAAVAGLMKVPNGTPVELVHLSVAGTVDGVLATTKVYKGKYKFNLDRLGHFDAPDIAVRVSDRGVQMRAFLTQHTVDISPDTEAVFQLVTDSIMAVPGTLLANFTFAELDDLAASEDLLTSLEALPAGPGIDATVTAIKDLVAQDTGITNFLVAATDPGQTDIGPGDIGNLFPLTQGNAWEYLGNSSDQNESFIELLTVTGTMEINNTNTMVLHRSNPLGFDNPYDEYLEKNSQGLYNWGNTDTEDFLSPAIVPYQEAAFPLKPGSALEIIYIAGLEWGEDLDGDGKNEHFDVSAKITTIGIEGISVPAGTFLNAVKQEILTTIDLTLSQSGKHIKVTEKITQWLAKDVGQVKVVTKTTVKVSRKTSTSTSTYELSAYWVDGNSSGDTDSDGVGDNSDNCPVDANAGQTDTDGDTQGDACDADDDNDDVPDIADAFPLDPDEAIDTDGDGIGNNADPDDDDDGIPDETDPNPLESDPDPGTASISGTLLVSTIGQPIENVVDEVEPNDTILTGQNLGPLTPDITYRVQGALPLNDPQDVYWLTESVAQHVTITLTHGVGVDFDLLVVDVAQDGTVSTIGESVNTTSPDQVIYDTPTPVPGESFITGIVVVPFSGSGSYELHIQAVELGATNLSTVGVSAERKLVYSAGTKGKTLVAQGIWDTPELDAVPGQYLVRLKSLPESAQQAPKNQKWRGLKVCGEVGQDIVVLCEPGSEKANVHKLSKAERREKHRRTGGRVIRLRAHPHARDVIPNFIVHPGAIPNDQFYPLQWHYPMIGLPEAWDTTTGSGNVIVAVLDTGITAHPDLNGRVNGGYDFVSSISRAGDGDGTDPDPTDPGDTDGTTPSSWHGTHVAGTIGASSNNNSGVAGVDWNAQIMPVRVLGRNGGTIDDVLNGIRYASGLANASGTLPAQQADIINMSLAGTDPGGVINDFIQPTIDQARQAGVLIVAAAGNENTSVPSSPAAANGVLSVSAVNAIRTLSYYSNYGSTIDIAAPGGDERVDSNGDGYRDGVLSTLIDNSTGAFIYEYYSGTSMAAPHVAGVAALCLAANPNLSVSELEDILMSTATDLGNSGRDDLYGHGLVNAAAAVQQAVNGSPNPTLEVSPLALNFGATSTQLEVAITNTGLDNLTVYEPTVTTNDGNPWLSATLTPVTVTPVLVQVNRAGLLPGRYAGRVTISSTGGTQVVEVSMDVAIDDVSPDVGTVIVRLFDPAASSIVQELQTTLANNYNYSFTNVPSGSYTIIASTDNDNDGVLCEFGEFCGAYPLLNEPVVVSVANGETLSGFDFAVTYQSDGTGEPEPPPNQD